VTRVRARRLTARLRCRTSKHRHDTGLEGPDPGYPALRDLPELRLTTTNAHGFRHGPPQATRVAISMGGISSVNSIYIRVREHLTRR
jgi:hypothetical protein